MELNKSNVKEMLKEAILVRDEECDDLSYFIFPLESDSSEKIKELIEEAKKEYYDGESSGGLYETIDEFLDDAGVERVEFSLDSFDQIWL